VGLDVVTSGAFAVWKSGVMTRAIARMKAVALLATVAFALTACSSMPEFSDFRAPTFDVSSFQIRDWNTYARSQTTSRAVTAQDLVDPSGRCAATAPAVPADSAVGPSVGPSVPPPSRGVGLDMTECEVATAIGVAPQSVDIGSNERGERNAILTYVGTDRAGIYHFVAGRLVSLERGPEPAVPVEAEKKPTKKQAKKPPKPQPTT
jgi:hypothetical protein